VLLMAVPKRLLKRAIDRNTLRRVAREAWRAGASAERPATPVLLRLQRRPDGFERLTQRARKRLWRAEIDALLAKDADA
jgi:RNase P protein component